jgi:hypothetical protein
MGKKNRKAPPEKERDVSGYYQLNTKAVDDLVTASPENSPKVSEEELRKYRSGPQIRLKDWLKTLLIKWWFNGAACFFFLWGLGTVVLNWENQLLILGLAIGFITDLMVNNIFRYYAKTPGANDRWMMFGKKGFASLPLNILYGFLLLFCVVSTYQIINGAVVSLTGRTESVPLGVEPILFGLFTTGYDFLFIGMKRMIRRIVDDARRGSRTGAR